MSMLDDTRTIVFSILVIVSLIGFLFWWSSTGGQPTPEQATEKLADEIMPFEIKLIQFVAEHLGGIIGAFIIIGIVWFFYGGKR